jgi:hypothetical protein
MLVKASCSCGNKDVKKFKDYDGSFGYEATVCLECGEYWDHVGKHEPDEWSLDFIGEQAYEPWSNLSKERVIKNASN